jgi:hypothetical protein
MCTTVVFAGCIGGNKSSEDPSVIETLTEETLTDTSTATGTPTESPTPTSRAPTSIKDSFLEISFGDCMAKKYLRYFDESSNWLKKLHPERDWWVEAAVDISNLGGETIQTPEISRFALLTGSKEATAMVELPHINWDQVRLRERHKAYWIEPGLLGPETIEPGKSRLVYLLFDATADNSPLLRWESGDGKEILRPEYFLSPD